MHTKKSGSGKRRGSDGATVSMIGTKEYTPSELNLQYTLNNTDNDSCLSPQTDRESGLMAREENEGLRLDQVLSAHGINRAKLAKKAGVAASTVQKWRDSLARGDIKPASWNS